MNVPLFFLIVLYPLDLIAFYNLFCSMGAAVDNQGSDKEIGEWFRTSCLACVIFTAAIIAIHCR